MSYDSRPDTYAHIQAVQGFLHRTVWNLLNRAQVHDQSKLSGIEKEAFDVISPRLRETEYASPEYKATLAEMRPAIQAHYRRNSHHPEHYPDQIAGMSLLDLIEMLCDWKAASLRHDPPGDLRESVKINQERFGFSDEVASVLVNTAAELGLLD